MSSGRRGRKAGVGAQGRRLIRLYKRLKTGAPVTYAWMKEEFGIGHQTARSDLNLLAEELQGLLDHADEPGGTRRWYLVGAEAGFDVKRWQVLALLIGAQMTSFLSGRRFHSELSDLLSAIREALPAALRDELELLAGRIHVVATGQKRYDLSPHRQAILTTLMDALVTDHRVALTYRSRGASSAGRAARSLTVEPLAMVLYNSATYFIVDLAADTAAEQSLPTRLQLALDRVESAQGVPDGKFLRPKDFSVADYYESAFASWPQPEPVSEPTVIRISPTLTPAVRERTWHGDQEIFALPDGGLEVRLPVGGPEVLTWVRSMGPDAEIIAPAALREAMRQNLEAALAPYRDEGC